MGRKIQILLGSGNRLLAPLYRYIELNPVRAGMVSDPGEYRWSSYQIDALGKESDLCTAHQKYLDLGKGIMERQINYRFLFTYQVEGELLEEIRTKNNKGWRLDMTASKKR